MAVEGKVHNGEGIPVNQLEQSLFVFGATQRPVSEGRLN